MTILGLGQSSILLLSTSTVPVLVVSFSRSPKLYSPFFLKNNSYSKSSWILLKLTVQNHQMTITLLYDVGVPTKDLSMPMVECEIRVRITIRYVPNSTAVRTMTSPKLMIKNIFDSRVSSTWLFFSTKCYVSNTCIAQTARNYCNENDESYTVVLSFGSSASAFCIVLLQIQNANWPKLVFGERRFLCLSVLASSLLLSIRFIL